ncbi:serine/threonine-protein kinase [Nonomuraea sp. NPDC050556]|uniref:serine/threonine-protein kinase n=1 Tax=Nonomuraea sp. NPDC050556 TaxID=3364369 RepID=UPI0037B27A41
MIVAGRYHLLDELGRGGMGVVWRAHDTLLDRTVAIKQLLTREEQMVERMLAEARAAAKIRHPNVVTIYDVVEADGGPWIVMDLLPARSLEDVLRQYGPMGEEQAARIGRDVLAALGAAHALGITHRDVKPANILLLADGTAVLTDFGIAQISGDPTMTATGMLVGSPSYMAPERANGHRAGPASDLWSLGVVLYACVEGRSPFAGDTLAALFAAVLTRAPDPMTRANGLRPLITGLLEKDPDRRLTGHQAHALLNGGGPATRSLPAPIVSPPVQQALSVVSALAALVAIGLGLWRARVHQSAGLLLIEHDTTQRVDWIWPNLTFPVLGVAVLTAALPGLYGRAARIVAAAGIVVSVAVVPPVAFLMRESILGSVQALTGGLISLAVLLGALATRRLTLSSYAGLLSALLGLAAFLLWPLDDAALAAEALRLVSWAVLPVWLLWLVRPRSSMVSRIAMGAVGGVAVAALVAAGLQASATLRVVESDAMLVTLGSSATQSQKQTILMNLQAYPGVKNVTYDEGPPARLLVAFLEPAGPADKAFIRAKAQQLPGVTTVEPVYR